MSYKRKSPMPIIEGGTNSSSYVTNNAPIYFDGTQLVTNINGYPTARFVVGVLGEAGYQTIQAGLDAANAVGGGVVYVQPSSTPYTENLVFYDNVSIIGSTGNSDVPNAGNTVTIVGQHTPPLSGYMSIKDCYLMDATAIFFSAAAGTAQIVLGNCVTEVTNGYVFDMVSWIAPGAFIGFNNNSVQGVNSAWVNNTDQATLYLQDSIVGSGTGTTMIASGIITMKNVDVNCPLELRKNGINNIDNCRFGETVTATINCTGIINFSRFNPGSLGPAFVMSSTDPIRLSNCVFNTPNNPAIDGAGGGLLTLSAASFIDNTLIAGTVNVAGSTGFLPAEFGTTGQLFTSNGPGVVPSFQAPAASSISITGDTGGALVGAAFTFSGGTTGLSFGGSGSTETLTFAGITANGGTVSLATDATTSTINVGTGAGVKTVTLGSVTSTSATTVRSGSGALAVTSTNGTLTINSGTGALGISTDASATTVSFATGGAVKTVTLGSVTSTSATTVRSGSGALNVTSTNGTMTINSGTGALSISNDASATTITLGTGGAVKGITIGSTSSTSSVTIACGTSGVSVGASANNHTSTFGSTSGTSTSILQAGSGGITLTGVVTSANAISVTSGNITATSGNLDLTAATTSTVGQITQGGTRLLHTFNTQALFIGSGAGNFTMSGSFNTGVGYSNLTATTSGQQNTTVGWVAGNAITSGSLNTVVGAQAFDNATTGSNNTVMGAVAMGNATTAGDNNTAIGFQVLSQITTGANNTALGVNAGLNLTGTDSNNILIGAAGVTGDNQTIRIGVAQTKTFLIGVFGTTVGVTGVPVVVDNANQLGTIVSSRRFKDNIKDMGKDSDALYKLRPVSFTYKKDKDHKKQYGLIAEEVEQIVPELVAHDEFNKPMSVKYHDLPALLLNEIQKLKAEIDALKRRAS